VRVSNTDDPAVIPAGWDPQVLAVGVTPKQLTFYNAIKEVARYCLALDSDEELNGATLSGGLLIYSIQEYDPLVAPLRIFDHQVIPFEGTFITVRDFVNNTIAFLDSVVFETRAPGLAPRYFDLVYAKMDAATGLPTANRYRGSIFPVIIHSAIR